MSECLLCLRHAHFCPSFDKYPDDQLPLLSAMNDRVRFVPLCLRHALYRCPRSVLGRRNDSATHTSGAESSDFQIAITVNCINCNSLTPEKTLTPPSTANSVSAPPGACTSCLPPLVCTRGPAVLASCVEVLCWGFAFAPIVGFLLTDACSLRDVFPWVGYPLSPLPPHAPALRRCRH